MEYFQLSFCLSMIFMLIQIALGCHPSCNCIQDANGIDNTCISCRFPGSIIDKYNASCPCPNGYFRSSLIPFNCTSLHNASTVDEVFSQCRFEIGMEISNFAIAVQQQEVLVNKVSVLNSTIIFDMQKVSLSDSCLEILLSSFQVFNLELQQYEPLLPLNQLNFTNTISQSLSQTVLVPISLIENYSEQPIAFSDGTVSYNVRFAIFFATTSDILRAYSWNLTINVQQKQTFLFSVQNKTTPSQQLQSIVVADIQTKGFICSNSTCLEPQLQPKYTVGDNFFIKVYFTDPKYNRKLTFSRTFLKMKSGQLLNYTPITQSSPNGSDIIIQFPLLDPSDQIIVQVNLLISNSQTLLRNLQDINEMQDQQIIQEIFEISVASEKTKVASRNHGEIQYVLKLIVALVLFHLGLD